MGEEGMQRRAAMAMLGLAGLPRHAWAQPAPGRTIRLIVPYAPGGGTDILTRLMAPSIGEALSTTVVVENRPGGNSAIGTDAVARAAPDGQTIGMIDLAFLVNPSLFNLPYDTLRDFAAIGLVATTPLVLMVNPRLGVRTMSELAIYIRANAGKASFASAGVGTAVHIAGEQLRRARGTDLQHVTRRQECWPLAAKRSPSASPAHAAPPHCPTCRPWASWACRAWTRKPSTASSPPPAPHPPPWSGSAPSWRMR
jgi:tripartite-type tricarboxylate transporter receptor subunit TctC